MGGVVETNQYAVTEHVNKKLSPDVGPGLYFRYDLSPVKVHIRESFPHGSLFHFFTSLCAAVGGVFTVAGLVDAMVCDNRDILRHFLAFLRTIRLLSYERSTTVLHTLFSALNPTKHTAFPWSPAALEAGLKR